MGEFTKTLVVHSQRVAHPPLLEGNLVVGLFDGASQNGGEKCGAWVVLKCPKGGVYSIKMNCETRGELLALWSLLFLTLHK